MILLFNAIIQNVTKFITLVIVFHADNQRFRLLPIRQMGTAYGLNPDAIIARKLFARRLAVDLPVTLTVPSFPEIYGPLFCDCNIDHKRFFLVCWLKLYTHLRL